MEALEIKGVEELDALDFPGLKRVLGQLRPSEDLGEADGIHAKATGTAAAADLLVPVPQVRRLFWQWRDRRQLLFGALVAAANSGFEVLTPRAPIGLAMREAKPGPRVIEKGCGQPLMKLRASLSALVTCSTTIGFS